MTNLYESMNKYFESKYGDDLNNVKKVEKKSLNESKKPVSRKAMKEAHGRTSDKFTVQKALLDAHLDLPDDLSAESQKIAVKKALDILNNARAAAETAAEKKQYDRAINILSSRPTPVAFNSLGAWYSGISMGEQTGKMNEASTKDTNSPYKVLPEEARSRTSKRSTIGARKSMKEDLGEDIARYQRYVDYDMKHYGKISRKTRGFIDKAGLQVIKDQYGDYEVTAGHYEEACRSRRSMKRMQKKKNLDECDCEVITESKSKALKEADDGSEYDDDYEQAFLDALDVVMERHPGSQLVFDTSVRGGQGSISLVDQETGYETFWNTGDEEAEFYVDASTADSYDDLVELLADWLDTKYGEMKPGTDSESSSSSSVTDSERAKFDRDNTEDSDEAVREIEKVLNGTTFKTGIVEIDRTIKRLQARGEFVRVGTRDLKHLESAYVHPIRLQPLSEREYGWAEAEESPEKYTIYIGSGKSWSTAYPVVLKNVPPKQYLKAAKQLMEQIYDVVKSTALKYGQRVWRRADDTIDPYYYITQGETRKAQKALKECNCDSCTCDGACTCTDEHSCCGKGKRSHKVVKEAKKKGPDLWETIYGDLTDDGTQRINPETGHPYINLGAGYNYQDQVAVDRDGNIVVKTKEERDLKAAIDIADKYKDKGVTYNIDQSKYDKKYPYWMTIEIPEEYKECFKKSKLTEKNWEYSVSNSVSREFRDAVQSDDEDYERVRRAIIAVYDDIHENAPELLDDDDYEDWVTEEAEVVDLDDDDDVNYLLTNLYDFCDNANIWIGI